MKKRKQSNLSLPDESVIDKLRSMHGQLNKDFGISKIGIFGSYIRGDYNKNSDLDLLVEFDRPMNLFEFSRLKRFLTNQLGIQVDLVTPGALKPSIKDKILESVAYI
jgi:predicted nucleotidyltransferase